MNNKSVQNKLLKAVLLASVLLTPLAFAGKLLPDNAKPLSKVIEMLEKKGYHPIIDVELERGRWEIEAFRDNVKRELKVDAVTGEIVSERRDD
ncbi:hypothetical protein GZ77_24960 [Endozoicomonas montiporae]|uniref:PepSY domain-containing protein n=2 Tax=Endozoicomonas montiporae TaxID=1027273 RepID=A0A081MYU7_9GAMM|nr:PepSY domain-containing protein [Endozoicomonas montiporae]AMO54832.1 hypothetical protein EZMO1_0590 [Endozoicomonas montiporae CL-33]KEQ11370.1 hypothetical protein GZ77_24960 [Endozoicomonas montiporae]